MTRINLKKIQHVTWPDDKSRRTGRTTAHQGGLYDFFFFLLEVRKKEGPACKNRSRAIAVSGAVGRIPSPAAHTAGDTINRQKGREVY